MKLFVIVLIAFHLIGNDVESQTSKFNINQFISTSLIEWTSKIQLDSYNCAVRCRNLFLSLKSEVPTLPPFYFNVIAQIKTTVNCSGELRRLQPFCNGRFRFLDVVQIGGNQYWFPLTRQLTYFSAQKFCRSNGLDLASLKNQSLEGYLISTYLKYYTNMLNLTTTRFNFWDGRVDRKLDPASALICSSFSLNISDFRGMVAVRANETCTNINNFICEVPTLCYRDICRGNFISRFTVTPSPVGAVTTTPGPMVANLTPPFYICEQCHLNHQIMFTAPCTELNCPTCTRKIPFDRTGANECNGKYYFFYDSKFSYYSAVSACCSLGMQPVNINSDDDVECIKTYLYDKGFKPSDMENGRWMWTSATDQGTNCNGRFAWCGTNTPVNGLSRMPIDPANMTDSDCLALFVRSSSTNDFTFQLATKTCILNFPVLCEATAPPEVPRTSALMRSGTCSDFAKSCPKGAETLERTIQQNEIYRRAGGIKSALICNNYYQVYTGVLPFDGALKACTDNRLEMATIFNYEELNCLRDFHLALRFGNDLKDMEATGEKVFLKSSDRSCNGAPLHWCNTGSSVSQHLIRPGQSKTGQNSAKCLAVDVKLSRYGLTTLPCDIQFPTICKENTTCVNPTCPTVNCAKYVSVAPNSGKDICGKTYIILEDKKKMKDALETCCQMGMGLLSIESVEEQNCLYRFMKANMARVTKVWTSATDMGCKSKFAWCATGEMLVYDSFNNFQNQPQTGNFFTDENCVSATFEGSPGQTLLMREQCGAIFPYICEVTRTKFLAGNYSGPESPSLNYNFNTTQL
ncbi:Hypothetical predicted protein [Cloeon dipterum]|uniref:C-type lectin domain-containing protein n=1 Tax=Cloeon dipterum TaxID=197152 RepID=A0A8S1D1S6_9INSE|nr:Hypothetical predicted protein [Cloeon dipterum]